MVRTILDFIQHPDTGANYIVPRNQVNLTFPSERRSGTIRVPGMDGGADVYGDGPFPRDVARVVYRFRVTPFDKRRTFDEVRDEFVKALSHGKRQRLGFITDSGQYRIAHGKVLSKPLAVNNNAPYWADYEVAWEVKDPLLSAPNAPGVVTWGAQQKWGAPGLVWGGTPYAYSLTTAQTTILVDNQASGATAETTDMTLSIAGAFGPAVPAIGTDYILIQCLESGTSFSILDTLAAGEAATLDFGGRSVTKNGQPVFGTLFRNPGQRHWLAFKEGVINTLVVSIVGTPRSPLSGRITINWLPKYEP